MANLEYRGHLISISVIYDTPNKFQFTPVIDIRRAESIEVLNTILTQRTFDTVENATKFGFELGREWVDERLSESPSRRLSPGCVFVCSSSLGEFFRGDDRSGPW